MTATELHDLRTIDTDICRVTSLSRACFTLYDDVLSGDQRYAARAAHELEVGLVRNHWLGLARPTEAARARLTYFYSWPVATTAGK